MKNKYLYIKIAGIASLLFLIFLYFVFYFMPTVEAINRYKRDLKDMNYKIENFLSNEKEFDFPTDRERRWFHQAEEDLKRNIAEIKSKEDFVSLFTEVYDYVKTRARRDGIFNLVVNATSNELELSATTLSNDKNTLERLLNFATLRLTEVRKKMNERRLPAHMMDRRGNPMSHPPKAQPLLENMKFQRAYLSFTGDLKNAMNFVNHLSWCPHFLRLDNITITAGDPFPYYWVQLKVYFIDQRSRDVK